MFENYEQIDVNIRGTITLLSWMVGVLKQSTMLRIN